MTNWRAQPEPVFGGGEHDLRATGRAQPEPVFGGLTPTPRALLVDHGGVLTTDVFAAFAAGDCVYVDDLPGNLKPARELGMITIHHRDTAATVAELERIFRVPLRDSSAVG